MRADNIYHIKHQGSRESQLDQKKHQKISFTKKQKRKYNPEIDNFNNLWLELSNGRNNRAESAVH